MSNHRHGRQPLPVEEFGGPGKRYGRLSANDNATASNNCNRRVVATKSFLSDYKEDDDERARRMAYIFSRRPDDPKRKRNEMRGKSLEEAMAINFGGPSLSKLDNDEAERIAHQKHLPPDITSISQLKWHRTRTLPSPQGSDGTSKSSRKSRIEAHLMPCYVLSRKEAASYRRKMGATSTSNSTTPTATTLVQYLTLQNPQRGQYKYVDETSLLPFGAEDGSSSSFNDTYLQRYMAQEMAQNQKGLTKPTPWDRPIEDTMKIMRIYLMRVFDTAWNLEVKSREMARNDLQDYYDDEVEDDDGRPIANAKKKGKSIKLPKKKKVEVLELDDDEDEDEDDTDVDNDAADTNIFEECSDHDDADDNDMDDLDAPYTQAITYDPDDFRMDDDEGVSNEPIRPGDVIEYYSPIYVAGDPRGLRRATVLSIDPKESMPLVLSNGEGIPKTIKVKRVKVMSGGDLLDHPGIFRVLCMFKLRKLGSATAADGIAMETARFGSIMKKNVARMQEMAEGDGFAPMDLLVNIKGANDDVRGRNSTETKRKVSGSSSARKVASRSMSCSSSSDSSSEDEIIANIRSRHKLKKSTSSIARRSIDSKSNGGKATSKSKGKVGSLLMSESSDSSDDSSIESSPVNCTKESRCNKTETSRGSIGHTKSRDRYGIDLSLSSDDDDDSILSNLQPSSVVRGKSSVKKQANAPFTLDSKVDSFTPESKSYPVQSLSRAVSKSTAKTRSSPSSDLSSSEESDVELNFLKKPLQSHNKNKAKATQSSLSGKSASSSESINLHRKSEEQMDDAEERATSSRETFGWIKGSAGWKKASVDGSGFSFARHK